MFQPGLTARAEPFNGSLNRGAIAAVQFMRERLFQSGDVARSADGLDGANRAAANGNRVVVDHHLVQCIDERLNGQIIAPDACRNRVSRAGADAGGLVFQELE